MPTQAEDYVDALCTGLLRNGHAPVRSNDALLYSNVIAERVKELLPTIEEACQQWPEAYPERLKAERLITQTREAIAQLLRLLGERPAPRGKGALYPAPVAVSVPPAPAAPSPGQLCERLARAQQALRRFRITVANPQKAAKQ